MADGWLRTGDRGYFDADENVFVTGRYKELIKYRLAHVRSRHCKIRFDIKKITLVDQVVPTRIEKHLLTHAAVADAAVVGRPDDVDGERPTAFVVVRPGHVVSAEQLVRFVRGLGFLFVTKVHGDER